MYRICEIKDGLRHGLSSLVDFDRDESFIGTFDRKEPSGPGREKFKDGTVFEGTYEFGLMKEGTMTESDGKKYSVTYDVIRDYVLNRDQEPVRTELIN